MIKRWRSLWLLFPLASAAALAFASGRSASVRARLGRGALSEHERKAIIGTLRQFDRIYQDFFSSGGGAAMIDAFPATKSVKHHVFRDVGFVRGMQLVLVMDLVGVTPVEVRRTGSDTVEAVVYEEWNYLYEHAADRSAATQLRGMGQGFRYRLRRDEGRWMITGWDFEDVKPPRQDKGFVF